MAERVETVRSLRSELPTTLGRMGLPWLATLLAGTGVSTPDVGIFPFLWFGPPLLLRWVWRAARAAPAPASTLWMVEFALGSATWLVAVPLSVFASVDVIGLRSHLAVAGFSVLLVGVLLHCLAMRSTCRQLGWTAQVRMWTRTVMVLVAGELSMLLITLLAWQNADGALDGARDPVVVLEGLVVFLLAIVPLILVARSHGSTVDSLERTRDLQNQLSTPPPSDVPSRSCSS